MIDNLETFLYDQGYKTMRVCHKHIDSRTQTSKAKGNL